ncbi:MAG: InlB B-repeat-containing protein [Spirochaetaceae bacterium]|nr:InlB B-repeat-containing protein [Spirochaetaceae bacterium]
MASLASVVSDPSPRQIVAYKDTSTGGNTYKTTDTVTLNNSNFTSRNITLQAKLNFTATISGGDTTISGQDGTYANPYHLKLGGTATEQRINIDITDKVGDIRIRAGTTGFVGVTGSGTSFAAEISNGIDPNSVPATPILLKIIDVVPDTALTTAEESNPANLYATKEVYVQIDRPTLTVTFSANGGTNAPASVSVLYGNKISAPTTSPSKNGATFGGWYTSNDGGATLSATQFNFTSTSITSNLTLYANWLPLSVALNVTSGDITSLVFGESVVLTATPTNFPGTPTYTWNISPSGASAIATITSSGTTASVTPVAGKSGTVTVSVTATYNSGGNTLTATSTNQAITVKDEVSIENLDAFLQALPVSEATLESPYTLKIEGLTAADVTYDSATHTQRRLKTILMNNLTKYLDLSQVTLPAPTDGSLNGAFSGCTNLVKAPAIPNNVTTMQSCFTDCSNLKYPPASIGTNVSNMNTAFQNCTSLQSAPVIPANVQNITYCFDGCSALSGDININMTETGNISGTYNGAFSGCTPANITAIHVPNSAVKADMEAGNSNMTGKVVTP